MRAHLKPSQVKLQLVVKWFQNLKKKKKVYYLPKGFGVVSISDSKHNADWQNWSDRDGADIYIDKDIYMHSVKKTEVVKQEFSYSSI